MKTLTYNINESLASNIGIGVKDCEVMVLRDFDGDFELYTFKVKAFDALDALCKIYHSEKGKYIIEISDNDYYEYVRENNPSKRQQLFRKLMKDMHTYDTYRNRIYFIRMGNKLVYQDPEYYIEDVD